MARISRSALRRLFSSPAPLRLLLLVLLLLFWCDGAFAEEQVRVIGDDLQLLLPTLALGMTAEHCDGEGALQFLKAGLLSSATTLGLKYSIHDNRPNGGPNSFPSGHTTISFASAEFLRKRYGWNYGLPAYLAATYVGYSRLDCQAHDIDDVVAGALIGIGSSYFLTEPYHGWNVQLGADTKSLSVNLTHSW